MGWLLVVVMMTVVMMCTVSKSLVTANVTFFGPLSKYLEGLGPQHAVAVQEHHITVDSLGEQQEAMQQAVACSITSTYLHTADSYK